LAHIAASREDWQEAQEQARIAVASLTAGAQWTLDVEPAPLLSFAMNLLGETLVRSIEGGDLFMTDKQAFRSIWNEAAELFVGARKVDPTNSDARRNSVRYRKL
jgi:hypothetical protein